MGGTITDSAIMRSSPIFLEGGAAAIGVLCVLSTINFCLDVGDTVLLIFAIVFSFTAIFVTCCGRGGRMEAASVVAPVAGLACYAGAAKLCEDAQPDSTRQTIIVYSASGMLSLAAILRFVRTVDLCCKRRHERSIEEKPLVEQTETTRQRGKAKEKKTRVWGRSSSKKPGAKSPSATTNGKSGYDMESQLPPHGHTMSPTPATTAADADADNPFGFEREEQSSASARRNGRDRGGDRGGDEDANPFGDDQRGSGRADNPFVDAYGSSRDAAWAPKATPNYKAPRPDRSLGSTRNNTNVDDPWPESRAGGGGGAYGV